MFPPPIPPHPPSRPTRCRFAFCALVALAVLSAPPAGGAGPATPAESDRITRDSEIPFETFATWMEPEHFDSFLLCFTPDFGSISGKTVTPPASGNGPTRVTFTSVPKKITSRAVVSRMDVAMDVARLPAAGCAAGETGVAFDLVPRSATIVTSIGATITPSMNGAHARLTLCGSPTDAGTTSMTLRMSLFRPSGAEQDPTLKMLLSPRELLQNNLGVLIRSLSPGACSVSSFEQGLEELEGTLEAMQGEGSGCA